MEQLTVRVHVETRFHGSNNGVIVGDGGDVVLVDAPQLPVDARRWARTVTALGRPRFLVNTDHHPDHTVGNRWLGGAVVAHRQTRRRLVEERPALDYLRELFAVIGPDSVPLLDGYRPRLPEVTFDERLELWVGETRVVLLHAPGHTANTIMVHVPDEGALFTGDNVCEASLPAFVDSRVDDLHAALDLAASLPCDHVVPGHGAVTGPEGIGRYRDRLRALVAEVADARDRGMTREECGAHLRYEDRIHRDVPGQPDYPAELVDHFQARSIEQIYDDLERVPRLRDR